MVGKTENVFIFLSYDKTNVFVFALRSHPFDLML